MPSSWKNFAGVFLNKIIGFAALFVLVAGMAGNIFQDRSTLPADFGISELSRLAVYDFIKALKLFSPGLPDGGVRENWLLVCARLIGSLVAMAAVFKLITTVFEQDISNIRASFYRNHAVVLGYGVRNARLLADSEIARVKNGVVIIDNDADKAKSFSSLKRALFFKSDLSIPGAMTPANIRRAGLVLISSGADERNLALVRSVVRMRTTPQHPASIVLTINDAELAERCTRDKEISRPQNGDDVFVLNVPILTARSLLTRTPFSDIALAAGQPRVHLVVAGFSDVAQEVIVQFLRISPCRGLAQPRIDIIDPDRTAVVNRLLDRCPNLAFAIKHGDGAQTNHAPLAWAVDIRVHTGKAQSLCHNDVLAEAAGLRILPTAIILGGTDAAENVRVGLALKMAERVTGLNTPVYVRMPMRSSLEVLLTRYDGGAPTPANGPLSDLRGSKNLGDVLEPFGAIEDICRMESLSGERERLSRKIHEAYRAKRRQEGKADVSNDPSIEDWQVLDETYRQANRRSADHLPVKLLSIGVAHWRQSQGLDLIAQGLSENQLLEELARLEHDSWRIDRELDGWRYGPERDNRSMLHPDLVDYDKLSDRSKDYDREMIRVVASIERGQ